MNVRLWTITGLAGPLLIILLLQTIAATLFILLVLFPLMGRDYQATMLNAGFGGFTVGATRKPGHIDVSEDWGIFDLNASL